MVVVEASMEFLMLRINVDTCISQDSVKIPAFHWKTITIAQGVEVTRNILKKQWGCLSKFLKITPKRYKCLSLKGTN